MTIPTEIAKTPELSRTIYVGSKILADQFIFSSLYTAYFFYGVGLVGGKSLQECKEDIKHKFVSTYATVIFVYCITSLLYS